MSCNFPPIFLPNFYDHCTKTQKWPFKFMRSENFGNSSIHIQFIASCNSGEIELVQANCTKSQKFFNSSLKTNNYHLDVKLI